MRNLRFDPKAQQEFDEAVDHYLEVSQDVASYFIDAFEEAIDLVWENPHLAVRIEGEVRRWNLRRFPYAVIYEPQGEDLVIVAVMPGRRDPDYWKSHRARPSEVRPVNREELADHHHDDNDTSPGAPAGVTGTT